MPADFSAGGIAVEEKPDFSDQGTSVAKPEPPVARPKPIGWMERFSSAAAQASETTTIGGLEDIPEAHMRIELPRAGFTPKPDDNDPILGLPGVTGITKGSTRKAAAILANAGASVVEGLLSPETPAIIAAAVAAPEVVIPLLTATMGKAGGTSLGEAVAAFERGDDDEGVKKAGEAFTALGFAAAPALKPGVFAKMPTRAAAIGRAGEAVGRTIAPIIPEPIAKALAPLTTEAAARTGVIPPMDVKPVEVKAAKPAEVPVAEPPKAEELMTPDEFDAMKKAREAPLLAQKQAEARARLAAGELVDPNKIAVATQNERGALRDALENKRPVNAALFDRYNAKSDRPLTLPDGYVKEGDLYIHRPEAPKPPEPPAGPAPAEAPKPVPLVEEIEPFGTVRQFRVTKEFVNTADKGTYKVGDIITEPQLTKAGLPVPEVPKAAPESPAAPAAPEAKPTEPAGPVAKAEVPAKPVSPGPVEKAQADLPEWVSGPQQGKVYRQFRILENRFKNGTPAERHALDMISDNEFGTRRADFSRAQREGVTEQSAQEAYTRLMKEGGLAWSPGKPTSEKRQLRTRKLPVGDTQTAGSKHEDKPSAKPAPPAKPAAGAGAETELDVARAHEQSIKVELQKAASKVFTDKGDRITSATDADYAALGIAQRRNIEATARLREIEERFSREHGTQMSPVTVDATKILSRKLANRTSSVYTTLTESGVDHQWAYWFERTGLEPTLENVSFVLSASKTKSFPIPKVTSEGKIEGLELTSDEAGNYWPKIRPAKPLSEPPIGEGPEGGAAGGSLSGTTLAPAPSASVPSLPLKSQRQIITDIAHGLKLPIRFGRLRTSKFAGYFLKVQDLIGVRRALDVPIVSHEAGHKLDATFKFSGDPTLRAELDALGDPALPGSRSSWTPSKTKAYRIREGVAEFVRRWLTDPTSATSMAPNMERHFNAILDANIDLGTKLRQAREDIRLWQTAEPQARLRSHISVGSNPNHTPYTFSQLMRDVVDDLHFLRLATDDAQTNLGSSLPSSKNPYILARNLRGSYGMADTFIRTGVTDFSTKEVTLGTSLQDALRPIAGRMNDFRDWIVAKQAQEMHAQGKTTGLLPSDVNTVVARFAADTAFNDAFTKVKEWNDALLDYAVDSGLVTPESRAAMRAMYQDFVPFHRVFEVGAGEAPSAEAIGIGRGLNVGTPGSLRARKGSTREIVDPMETMIRNAYTIITASEKAAINRAVADFANLPGMGKWVEHIATPKDRVRVGIDKLREQLEDAGADLTNVPDDLLLTFFQNSRQAPYGENIIRIVKDGKPEFYRLRRELFDTFHALDLEDAGTLVRWLASPAQVLRAGVTATPDFALANAFRDTFGAAVISKYGAYPFEVTIRGISSLLRDPKLVSEWAASGGKQAVEATYFDRAKLQTFLKQRITKDLSPIERMLIVSKSPLMALRFISGFFEEATRLGEYKKAYDTLRGSGMPEGEARRMAAFEARDRQDFAMGGAKTKIVRRLAAFWNAGLQGNVRLAKAFKERPVRTTLQGLAFITIPKLIEQALNWDDDDYWDRPQWERDRFFLIPLGKGDDGHTRFLRLPSPFVIGTIFGTLPGRIMEWRKQNNPDALASFPKELLSQSVPNPMPQSVQVVFETFLSGPQGYDVFRGRPIVSDRLADLPPEMQWSEQTSLSARRLGSALGFSPLKIDHVINSTTGGLGKQVVHQIFDRAIAMTGEQRTAKGTAPGGRFVTTPAAISSQAINDFYTIADQLKANHLRVTQTGQGEDSPWYEMFEKQRGVLAELRSEIRQAPTESDKAQLRELILNVARETMRLYREQTANQ